MVKSSRNKRVVHYYKKITYKSFSSLKHKLTSTFFFQAEFTIHTYMLGFVNSYLINKSISIYELLLKV